MVGKMKKLSVFHVSRWWRLPHSRKIINNISFKCCFYWQRIASNKMKIIPLIKCDLLCVDIFSLISFSFSYSIAWRNGTVWHRFRGLLEYNSSEQKTSFWNLCGLWHTMAQMQFGFWDSNVKWLLFRLWILDFRTAAQYWVL